MGTLPQLTEEDIRALDRVLLALLARTDATVALIMDKGGFLITHQGLAAGFDLTTISALASGAYLANQTIANLVQEVNFDSVYQQGEHHSMFVANVDENCLLLVIFRAQAGVGMVKYWVGSVRPLIAAQMQIARQRNPEAGLDLSALNLADTTGLFKRQA